MKKFMRKVKEVGWKNTLIGFLKRLYYSKLTIDNGKLKIVTFFLY